MIAASRRVRAPSRRSSSERGELTPRSTEPSFSTVSEPPTANGTNADADADVDADTGGVETTREPKDMDDSASSSSSSLSIEGVSHLTREVESSTAVAAANAERLDESMVFSAAAVPSHNSRTLADKHKSLGPEYLGGLEAASLPQRRAVGGPRHRSLMRRERSKDSYGRAAPNFLEGLAERVRSVSPSPASLSSDPARIIADSGLREGNKKSYSLGSHTHGRPNPPAPFAGERVSSGAGTSTGGVGAGGNDRHGSFTLSPSNSRSSGLEVNDGRRTPRSQQLSSTSLRRVLSLGRPRLDSDAYSAVSEPIVYADNAHVADDIWIAPKELFEVERRVAAGAERRERDKQAAAVRDRQVEALNRARALNSVTPERASPAFSLQGARRDAESMSGPVSGASANGVVDMEIDAGHGSMADFGRPLIAEDDGREVLAKDPAEFTNSDTSSRLLRLFFSSGSHNPVPPSAAKRAEEKRMQSRSGSSRRLLFRKMSDRGRSRSHLSFGASASHRNLGVGMGHHGQVKSDLAANSLGNSNPAVNGPESMSHDFDLKGRIRGIARIANIRRWLRSRTYRKHQKRPERRPREVVV